MPPLIARRPLDSLLYHQYLKGGPCNPSTDSLASSPSLPVDEIRTSAKGASTYHWDLRETYKHLAPAFDFISQKLSEENLSIHLIISDHSPFIIPVWPLPRKSQFELARIVRKACNKFNVKDSWMAALSSLNKKDMARLFETYKPDSYVVRRSIVQHEVIYSQEGLTLLSIDHIRTLKQILCTLTKPNWVSQQARQVCLASCVELLHRVQGIYTGKPVSKAYIARVYEDIPFQEDCLDEVCAIYDTTHCTATIHDVAFQPDFSSMVAEDTSELDNAVSAMPELPENVPISAIHPAFRHDYSNSLSDEDLVSPLAEVDLSRVNSLEALSNSSGAEKLPSINVLSPLDIPYPDIKRPSSQVVISTSKPERVLGISSVITVREQAYSLSEDQEDRESEQQQHSEEVGATGVGENCDLPAPTPLRISKSFSAIENDREVVSVPPSAASTPPLRAPRVYVPPFLPSTALDDTIESAIDATANEIQSYHQHTEEQETDEDEGIEVQTMLNLHHLNGGHSNHFDLNEEIAQLEKRQTWQSDAVLEDPAAYIESWSSGVVRECPPFTEPLPPPPTTAMLVGDVKCF